MFGKGSATLGSQAMALAGRAKGFFFFFIFSVVLYLGSIFFLPAFLLLLFLPWGVQISDKAHAFLASTFFRLIPVSLP